MELRRLTTFAKVAELESFTRAAEALAVSQAAVSQQVAALEKELGAPLFVRSARSVTLTDEGRRLHVHARQILDLVEQIKRDFGSPRGPVSGTLRIAASTVPSEWLLPELLAEFRRSSPHVRETVNVSDSRAAAEAVATGAADVGFVGELPRSGALRAQPIATDSLVLVVAPGHPWAERGRIDAARLAGQPIIIREPNSGSRRCLERALDAAGASLADMNVVMETNSNDAMRAAVERGVGAAFLSRATVRNELATRRLTTVAVDGLRAERRLYMVTPTERVSNAVLREFLQFVEGWRCAGERT